MSLKIIVNNGPLVKHQNHNERTQHQEENWNSASCFRASKWQESMYAYHGANLHQAKYFDYLEYSSACIYGNVTPADNMHWPIISLPCSAHKEGFLMVILTYMHCNDIY